MLKPLILLALLPSLWSCHLTPETSNFVPVVGLNVQGKSELKEVRTEVFKNEMSPFIGKMSEEISDTLDREESMRQTLWTLSRVTVGLALEAEFELFNVVEAETHADIELRFQKAN